MKNQFRPLLRWSPLLLLPLCAGLLVLSFSRYSGWSARGADILRKFIGDKPVAQLEDFVFRVQDHLQKMQYDLKMVRLSSPWQSEPTRAITITVSAPQASATPETASLPTPLPPSQTPTFQPTQTITPALSPTPLSTTPTPWTPPQATPLGTIAEEGIWTPYIQDMDGRVLAYRTYVQPDETRPYVIVGVVAIDLTHTHLRFVLGSEEPYNPQAPKRSGKIDPQDMASGKVIAAFNGGFKTSHGQFGAMADGLTVIEPRDGLGTLAIYQDERVWIGEWGKDLLPSDQYRAWRQNGPLVIQDGKINPRIYNNSPKDWGYTVNEVSPTWRSGVAISKDGNTLFYLAGPWMTMEALAKSMLAIGAVNGIQLDINRYWVLFVTVRFQDQKPILEPLFPKTMTENINRYMYPYTRDYFYLIANR